MARKPVVSRTIKSTKAVIMGVDTESKKVIEQEVILLGTFKDAEKVLKEATKLNENTHFKPVSVVSYAPQDKFYKMDLTKFIELAEESDE